LKFTLIQILWIKSLNKSLSFFALDIVIGSYRTYNRSLDGSHHYLISKKISKLQKKKLLQNLYKFPLWYNEKTKMILLKKKNNYLVFKWQKVRSLLTSIQFFINENEQRCISAINFNFSHNSYVPAWFHGIILIYFFFN
jgi:hypothetical protein